MTAFLVIGVVGILLLVVSLVLGEVFDGIFDAIGGDLVSGASVAAFLGAFGFAGGLVANVSGSSGAAIGAGLGAGVLVGGGAALLTRALGKDDDSTVRTSSLVGRSGSVVSAVPADGYGDVSLVVAGHITRLNARSSSALPAGTPVVVTAVLSATSVLVEAAGPTGPADAADPPPKTLS